MSSNLLDRLQRLADLLEQENKALKSLDFPAAIALAPAKEAALSNLAAPSTAGALPPSLATLQYSLNELATENQILLVRAISVQTRIVQIIARACACRPTMMRYCASGGRAPSHRAAALSLSTRA